MCSGPSCDLKFCKSVTKSVGYDFGTQISMLISVEILK